MSNISSFLSTKLVQANKSFKKIEIQYSENGFFVACPICQRTYWNSSCLGRLRTHVQKEHGLDLCIYCRKLIDKYTYNLHRHVCKEK